MFGLAEFRMEIVEEPIVVPPEIHYIDVVPGQQSITLPTGVERFALRFRDPVTNASVRINVPRCAQPGDVLVWGRVEDLAQRALNGKKIEASTRLRIEGKVENFSESNLSNDKSEKEDFYFCQAWSRGE